MVHPYRALAARYLLASRLLDFLAEHMPQAILTIRG
jgi:hypothetical protein